MSPTGVVVLEALRGSIPRWVGNKETIIGNFLLLFPLQFLLVYSAVSCSDETDNDDLIFDDVLTPRFVYEICFRFFPSLSNLT